MTWNVVMTFHHALTKSRVQRAAQPCATRARLPRFIVALLLFRIIDCATGCGPSDGEDGGDCIPPKDSCKQDPYCNPGLRCDYDNVCRPEAPMPSYGSNGTSSSGTTVVHITPAPRCTREDNPRCGAPAEGWTCRYGSPDDAGDCLNVLIDASTPGEGYCCAPPTSCYALERTDAGIEVGCELGVTAVVCNREAGAPDASCHRASLAQSTYGARGFCCPP